MTSRSPEECISLVGLNAWNLPSGKTRSVPALGHSRRPDALPKTQILGLGVPMTWGKHRINSSSRGEPPWCPGNEPSGNRLGKCFGKFPAHASVSPAAPPLPPHQFKACFRDSLAVPDKMCSDLNEYLKRFKENKAALQHR